MQNIDSFSFIYGISAAFYFMSCLMCGLQLCFGIFHPKQSSNVILSRLLGIILLALAGSAVFYILSITVPRLESFWRAGYAIDYLSLIFAALIGYVLYANNQPSVRTVVALALPFFFLVIIFVIRPEWADILLGIAGLILIFDYVYYSVSSRKRERSLDDLYSNPKPHSLKWLRIVTLLFVGWFVIHCVFQIPELKEWHGIVLFFYMTLFVLFVSAKVGSYGEPVNRGVQEEFDNMEWGEVDTMPESSSPMQKALIKLLEEEQIYLCPDLTVDDVVKRLGTNPKYLSAILHNDMHTSFCSLINEYRVNKAKELLKSTDNKISNVAMMCGFNSVQSFYRTFAKIVGKTPNNWRIEQE